MCTPRFPLWLLQILSGEERERPISGDLEELYLDKVSSHGSFVAVSWLWWQVVRSVPLFLVGSIIWSFDMFKNYMKIALRNVTRHKLYSFVNIFGLALGIAVCMIIGLWLERDLSYDRFHEKAGRIYRLERELYRDNAYSRWPITSGTYKQALIDDVPEIENAMRLWGREFSIQDNNNYVHRQSLFAVDNSIFEIFDFGLEEGDERTALSKPETVVLTRENALKYLGSEDAVGKSLKIEWGGEQVDFIITGILKEVAAHSHLHFDMLISISSYPDERFSDWRSNYLYTYVLAREGVSRGELEDKLKSFVSQRLQPHYGDLLSQGLDIHEVLKLHLFPITDIHLHPSPNWELGAEGNITSVYMFSTIAVLILVIACINFINLSTARAYKRAMEVSLRKTVGACKTHLRAQFIQESMMLSLLASACAVGLISLFLPLYNALFYEQLSIDLLLHPLNGIVFIVFVLVVGFLTGLYPALYLTRFEPLGILTGGVFSGRGRSSFRRNMVVLQFVISIALIIGTLTVYKQMQYIQNRPLGFDKENVLLIPVRSQKIAQNYQAFRAELLNGSFVSSLSVSTDMPGENFFSNTGFVSKERPEDPVSTIFLRTDYDFVGTYRVHLLAGRAFSRDFGGDTTGTLMLNEAAVRRFGWTAEGAISKELIYFGGMTGKIVGVLEDFNYRSLRREVEPLAVILSPASISAISVRILPGDVKRTIDFIERKWHDLFPGELFEFVFLDRQIAQLYESEMRMQALFTAFSCFSIFIASLGLLGLATFTVEERTKEIGIRKALGASTGRVVLLLSKEFIKWVVLANVVAWPLAWYVMNKWLQNFAYRASMGLYVFIFSSVVALAISAFTFSYQTIKAAQANPVKSLRYE